MRIAVVAPPWYSIPPAGYGGIEMLIAGLVDGLVERGHTLLLAAAGTQRTLAPGAQTLSEPAEDRLGSEVTSLLHASMAEEAVRDFEPDVVHDHTLPGLLAATYRPCPTVATVHGPPCGEYGEFLSRVPDVHLVAISRAQRRSAPHLGWSATVLNGIKVDDYPFREAKEDFLFFLGRMHPDKGVAEAIEVARKADASLVIAARIHGPLEEEFFDEVIRPQLGGAIQFVGEVGFEEKIGLLSRAQALLFPLQWEEPYGLVVAEAQACGTPVLSLRRGAIPELVLEGRTGWLADHHLELVEAVARVEELAPLACREHAVRALNIDDCIMGYERVFWSVASGRSATSSCG